jgi:hypothetical protein
MYKVEDLSLNATTNAMLGIWETNECLRRYKTFEELNQINRICTDSSKDSETKLVELAVYLRKLTR